MLSFNFLVESVFLLPDDVVSICVCSGFTTVTAADGVVVVFLSIVVVGTLAGSYFVDAATALTLMLSFCFSYTF